MLRLYFLQQWFNLPDPQAEDAIGDSAPMRRPAGVELGDDVVPDESTIVHFRHLLEQYGLAKGIFDEIGRLMEERRRLLRSGTIVEAAIIAEPSSARNAAHHRRAYFTFAPWLSQATKSLCPYLGLQLCWGRELPCPMFPESGNLA